MLFDPPHGSVVFTVSLCRRGWSQLEMILVGFNIFRFLVYVILNPELCYVRVPVFQASEGAFEDDDVTHIEGEVNPVRDLEIISEELRLKDEELLKAIIEKMERNVLRGTDKKLKAEYSHTILGVASLKGPVTAGPCQLLDSATRALVQSSRDDWSEE
uniref:Uncharacterized protein n=1 Tax=Timema bartmani TaxID=61472 RepID=A0A7R9FAK4_9NEOP|nr:unnamed protein product [Timema bartmani]